MTVSTPLTAPAWPPETGASMNDRPALWRAALQFARNGGRRGGVIDEHRAAASCRRRRPASPSTTERRSSSLPTQANTKSAPAAASRGVGAARRRTRPDPGLRLGGRAVVDRDARARHAPGAPPSGAPITPRPRKATLRGGRGLVGLHVSGGLRKHGGLTMRPREAHARSESASSRPAAARDQTIVRCSVPAARSWLRARWLLSLICSRRSFTESALRSASSYDDVAAFVQVEQRLVEGLHAELARALHQLLQLADLALEDHVATPAAC